MDSRKLLIADGSEEFRSALADTLQGAYCIRVCGDGQEALSMLRSFHPDILVLDLMVPGLDGISLLHAAAADGISPTVLATTRFLTEYISESIDRLGISYVMSKPCDIQATADRIGDLTQRIRKPLVSIPDPRTRISNTLVSLGIPTKLRGYTYLREAILLMSRDPDQAITKVLYPAVGNICGSNKDQVERSIRSAIEKAWLNRDDRVWQLYFPPGPDGIIPKPSNAVFISRLADHLILQQDIQL